MWNIKEEDLDGFRVTCSSRLSPEGTLGFMIGTIVYVSVMMFFSYWYFSNLWLGLLYYFIRKNNC